MGFRTGAFAKIWDVTPISDTSTKLRLSISRKNKSGEFEEDFSGFVLAIGTANAAKAAKLAKGDRIKLGDVDVSTKYDRDSKITYVNYKMFSFEQSDGAGSTAQTSRPDIPAEVDGGEFDESKLPY